jgi:hypothetical protein
MKHPVLSEAEAAGRKIEHALHGRAYSVLGFIFCAGLLLAVVSRSKAAQSVIDAVK